MSNFGCCALNGCLAFGAVAIIRIHVFNKSVSISVYVSNTAFFITLCGGYIRASGCRCENSLEFTGATCINV